MSRQLSDTALVRMPVAHAEAANGIAFKIEFDEHGGFVSDDGTVVPRIDGNDLRRREVRLASILVTDLNLATSQKADVSVHAEVGADDRLHVPGPFEAYRVDHSLDTASSAAHDVQPNTTHLFRFGIL